MKRNYIAYVIVFISVLTVLIIGMSIFSQNLLRKDSDRLNTAIDSAVGNSVAGNWKSAAKDLDEVDKIWSGVKGAWSALIDHSEIDNIDVTLTQLRTYVNSKELPDSLSEAAALKTYIGHIPEKEKLLLQNLF